VVEFIDGAKLTFSEEQYEELICTISKLKAFGRYKSKNLVIKSALQTYEKQYSALKHSFKYISKPVIIDEPLNVSRANFFPARKFKFDQTESKLQEQNMFE